MTGSYFSQDASENGYFEKKVVSERWCLDSSFVRQVLKWSELFSCYDFQNEQQMAKEFTKVVQDAEQTYQVCTNRGSYTSGHFR